MFAIHFAEDNRIHGKLQQLAKLMGVSGGFAAFWAEAFQLYPLVLDYVSVAVGGHWDAQFGEAVGLPTAGAGKMGVALIGRAVMRQFKIPRAVLHERLVDDIGGDEGLQCAVDRYLVGSARADSLCDLFAR